MRQDGRDDFQAWLWGEILLFGLLGSSLALFVTNHELQTKISLPQLGLVLSTVMAFAAAIIALLAGIRFAVEGRRLDLFLCTGFLISAASSAIFRDRARSSPAMRRIELKPGRPSSGACSRGASSPSRRSCPAGQVPARSPTRCRPRASRSRSRGSRCARRSTSLPAIGTHNDTPGLLVGSLAAQALLNLLAVVGFGKRFYERREDLDRWLALASTLMLFASLHYVFTPVLAAGSVSRGDALRLLAYGLLLAGAWRAISFAEFGRAVAEERARVAREIHDGLAQYLFAVSTHARCCSRAHRSRKRSPS